eukprot:m.23541 g.23541  ORF g.23541 m.23541 type:complete len:126 (-) comp7512_c0_seq1:102-479(-)
MMPMTRNIKGNATKHNNELIVTLALKLRPSFSVVAGVMYGFVLLVAVSVEDSADVPKYTGLFIIPRTLSWEFAILLQMKLFTSSSSSCCLFNTIMIVLFVVVVELRCYPLMQEHFITINIHCAFS